MYEENIEMMKFARQYSGCEIETKAEAYQVEIHADLRACHRR